MDYLTPNDAARNPVAPLPEYLAPYGAAVDALMPGKLEAERRQRAGVLYLRDRASKGLRTATWEAQCVLQAIETLATAHAYRDMTGEELGALWKSLNRLMLCATTLESNGPHA